MFLTDSSVTALHEPSVDLNVRNRSRSNIASKDMKNPSDDGLIYTMVAQVNSFLLTATFNRTKIAPSILIGNLSAAFSPRETGIRSYSLNPAAKNSFFDHRHDWQQESSLATMLILLGTFGKDARKRRNLCA